MEQQLVYNEHRDKHYVVNANRQRNDMQVTAHGIPTPQYTEGVSGKYDFQSRLFIAHKLNDHEVSAHKYSKMLTRAPSKSIAMSIVNLDKYLPK